MPKVCFKGKCTYMAMNKGSKLTPLIECLAIVLSINLYLDN